MEKMERLINEFNSKVLYDSGSHLKIVERPLFEGCLVPYYQVKLRNPKYTDSATLNLSEDFYEDIKFFFKAHDIELDFNNTGDIFWTDQVVED